MLRNPNSQGLLWNVSVFYISSHTTETDFFSSLFLPPLISTWHLVTEASKTGCAVGICLDDDKSIMI